MILIGLIFFQQAEKGFDWLFNYERPMDGSFEYYNTMKNRTIIEQISLKEKRTILEEEDQRICPEKKCQNLEVPFIEIYYLIYSHMN